MYESALPPRYTSVTLARLGGKDRAEALAARLRSALEHSYLKPEIGAAPGGGSFGVYVTTAYRFDAEDQEKALLDFMAGVLCHELAQELAR